MGLVGWEGTCRDAEQVAAEATCTGRPERHALVGAGRVGVAASGRVSSGKHVAPATKGEASSRRSGAALRFSRRVCHTDSITIMKRARFSMITATAVWVVSVECTLVIGHVVACPA